ncbi:MAG TPA: SpoIIE family protein phosphatase [Polyangia bacterium]|nr:SpoIIE family protein phosphatase [Polyangia bacterium]
MPKRLHDGRDDRAEARSFSFAARYSDVPRYVRKLQRALTPRLDARTCAALSEVLSNAIVHGALGIPGRGDADDLAAYIEQIIEAERELGDARAVSVTISRAPDGAVTVVVTDPGPGFDWRAVPARQGRGLGVLREIAAEVAWNDSGNRLEIRFAPGRRRGRLGARRAGRPSVPSRELVRAMPRAAALVARPIDVGTTLEYRPPETMQAQRRGDTVMTPAPRALVVDDVATNRRLLSGILLREGFHIREASTYVDALDEVSHTDFDVVLLDLALGEGGSGRDVLSHLETRPHDDAPIVIVVTGSERDGVSEAQLLDLGAHDYVTRPFDVGVLRARIGRALNERRRRQSLAARAREASETATVARAELVSGAELQNATLPSFPLRASALTASGVLIPNQLMSGDIVAVATDDEQRLTAFVLDVAGHGAAAALIGNAAWSTLRIALADGDPMPLVMARLERCLRMHDTLYSAAGLAMVRISADRRFAECVNAGMPPVTLIRNDGTRRFMLSTSPPSGTSSRLPKVETMELRSGDSLVMASDGMLPGLTISATQTFVDALLEQEPAAALASMSTEALQRCARHARSLDGTPDDDASMLILHLPGNEP